EDGIRDFHVTGVQTCALPISRSRGGSRECTGCERSRRPLQGAPSDRMSAIGTIRQIRDGVQSGSLKATEICELALAEVRAHDERSEERRVGKECRSRGWL